MKNQSAKRKLRSALRWIGWVLVVQFILITISAAFYAYKYSYFYNDPTAQTHFANENIFQKTWRLFTGPKFSKAANYESPAFPYKDVTLTTQSGLHIKGWMANTDSVAKGTVILFHGLSQNKAEKLSEANEFLYWGYNIFMIDFRAHGTSEGHVSTSGYREAEEVKLAIDYVRQQNKLPVFLWGSSMGAVAILKAIDDYHLKPSGIIIELSFTSLQSLIRARLRANGFSGLPEKPFAFLITFWTGIERGIKAFHFNTIKYAKQVNCPVLMQSGAHDHIVSPINAQKIFKNIASQNKKWVVYPLAAHESLIRKNTAKWREEVAGFLQAYTH